MKASVPHWQFVALLLLAAAPYSSATPSPRRSFFWQHNGKPPTSSNITQQADIGDVKNVSRHNQMVHKDRDHHDDFFKASSAKDARLNKQAKPTKDQEVHEHKMLLEFSHQLSESLPVQ